MAAPTGAGKTIVAEEAIVLARGLGQRLLYTTPIKALSNQKFTDLKAELGEASVGLLTGDHSVNGDAEVVVMTTEVLRNMLYAGPERVAEVGFVVLDEVHYLQDRHRGPVWEEVIISLPRSIQLVCLSATVSNVDQVGEWLRTVRGPTRVVTHTERPVPLTNDLLVQDRLSGELTRLPVLVDGRANRELERLERIDSGGPTSRDRSDGDRKGGKGNRSARRDKGSRGRHGRRGERGQRRESRNGDDAGSGRSPRRQGSSLRPPRRPDVLAHLAARHQLPAIVFVFSRKGCDDAAREASRADLGLVTEEEAHQLTLLADRCLDGLSAPERQALDAASWRRGFVRGIAPHHAGLLPEFREAAEDAMVRGLAKVVYATETLALGVNVPARSVVIEQLSKFNGEDHQLLTPGEYTQLTGRAGRRGLDVEGHAVVLWSPFVPTKRVASLVSSLSYPLHSAFRTTYNMATNLVAHHDPEGARRFLDLSFAQFELDAGVVQRESRRHELDQEIKDLQAIAADGDVPIGDLMAEGRTKKRRRDPVPWDKDHLAAAAGDLRPGDIVGLSKSLDPVAVVSVANRRERVKLRVTTPQGSTLTVSSDDLTEAPFVHEHVAPKRSEHQGHPDFLERLMLTLVSLAPPPGPDSDDTEPGVEDSSGPAEQADEEAHTRTRIEAHREVQRLIRRRKAQRAAPEVTTASVAGGFIKVHRVLEERGAVDSWQLTPLGVLVSRIFHEADLLVAEVIQSGALDGLDAPEMAAVLSSISYEHRSRDAPPPWSPPSRRVATAVGEITAIHSRLAATELDAGVEPTREPEPHFAPFAHRWASGEGLAMLEEAELTGGDFVRNVKQLIDLCRSVAAVAEGETAATAGEAARLLRRSVVSAGRIRSGDEMAEAEQPQP